VVELCPEEVSSETRGEVEETDKPEEGEEIEDNEEGDDKRGSA
jgi:hypothetical protein